MLYTASSLLAERGGYRNRTIIIIHPGSFSRSVVVYSYSYFGPAVVVDASRGSRYSSGETVLGAKEEKDTGSCCSSGFSGSQHPSLLKLGL